MSGLMYCVQVNQLKTHVLVLSTVRCIACPLAEERAPLTVTAAQQLARDTAAAHHSLNSLTM